MARQRLTEEQRKARQAKKESGSGFLGGLFKRKKAAESTKTSTGPSTLGGSQGRAVNRRNERMNATPDNPASNRPVAMERTKGGKYPQYVKNAPKAESFRDAFASARKAGKDKFSWDGREYTTEVAKKSGGRVGKGYKDGGSVRGYGMARGGKPCKMR